MNLLGKVVQWLIDKLYTVKSGHYTISPTVEKLMEKKGISEEDIKDVFRYGEEVRPGTRKRKYWSYTIGINFIKNEDGSYFIIHCWKYQNYYREPKWLKPKLYKG
jgi:hypothetical protein